MKIIQILEKVDWRERLYLNNFGKSAEKMFRDAIRRTNREGTSYFVNDKPVSEEEFESAENKLAIFSKEYDTERTCFLKNGYLPPTIYQEKRKVKNMYFVFK